MAARRTPKAKVETRSDGSKVYGPYPGSAKNDGRPMKVVKKGGKTTSTTAARDEKEKSLGRKLTKNEDAAHTSGTNKGGNKSISASSTRVQSKSANIASGNKTRASRGNNQHTKKRSR